MCIIEPIIEFKDEAQAYECLKEWQSRLFLNNWFIKLAFEPIEIEGQEHCNILGYCTAEPVISSAIITIAPMTADDGITKYCAEEKLVHELLHCVFPSYYKEASTIEEAIYETFTHLKIEQMAKSLIMAKYNLTFDWFKNF